MFIKISNTFKINQIAGHGRLFLRGGRYILYLIYYERKITRHIVLHFIILMLIFFLNKWSRGYQNLNSPISYIGFSPSKTIFLSGAFSQIHT